MEVDHSYVRDLHMLLLFTVNIKYELPVTSIFSGVILYTHTYYITHSHTEIYTHVNTSYIHTCMHGIHT